MTAVTAQPTGASRAVTWAVLLPVTLAVFLTSLDNTVVNVALPDIGRSFDLGPTGLQWVAAIYILAFGALLLPGGALVDRFGRRRLLVVGLLVLGAGSLAAGLASDAVVLVAARAVQGVGAALLVPATLAIVSTDLAPSRRALGGAVWSGAVAVAFTLGPVLGGVVTERWSWRWLFLVGVLVIVPALVAVLMGPIGRAAPAVAAAVRPRLDVAGMVTSAGAVACATAALVTAQDAGWSAPSVLTWSTGAVLLAVAFVVVERAADRPVAGPALLRDRVFTGGTVAQILWGAGLGGVLFATSLYLQTTAGWSSGRTGTVFLPVAVALVLTVPLAPVAARRVGIAATSTAGLLLVALGLVVVARIGAEHGVLGLLPGLVLVGAGSGLTTPLVTHVLRDVAPEAVGAASGITGAARELSAAVGIALTGAVLAARRDHLLGDGLDAAAAATGAYRLALDVAAAVLVVAAVVTAVTLRTTPARTPVVVPT